MVLVDTCGWIEWLTDGGLANKFQPWLDDSQTLLVPTAIQFELYKWLECHLDKATALQTIAHTTRCTVLNLDTPIALLAADYSREHKLSFADALIYASARKHNAQLITSDGHFKHLSGVTYYQKTS